MVHISELILPRIRNHTKNQNLTFFLNFEIFQIFSNVKNWAKILQSNSQGIRSDFWRYTHVGDGYWRRNVTHFKCVGDNYKMLVTVVATLITNILYHLKSASGTNSQKMSPTKIVANRKSPTSQCHQHDCSPFWIFLTVGWVKLFSDWLSEIITVIGWYSCENVT